MRVRVQVHVPGRRPGGGGKERRGRFGRIKETYAKGEAQGVHAILPHFLKVDSLRALHMSLSLWKMMECTRRVLYHQYAI